MAAESLAQTIMHLARNASVEINVQDIGHLEASRAFLPSGKRMYVSHLPRQSWHETGLACRAVRDAGFDPVPHIPARLLTDAASLDRLLGELVHHAQVREILLIAGDYPRALGPYSTVVEVLRSGLLDKHGLRRVSLAGHPEGHPKVPLDEIRRAELEKAALACEAGLDVTLLTQFFFEPAPFLRWARDMRSRNAHARLVAGLAGPASITAVQIRDAMRSGPVDPGPRRSTLVADETGDRPRTGSRIARIGIGVRQRTKSLRWRALLLLRRISAHVRMAALGGTRPSSGRWRAGAFECLSLAPGLASPDQRCEGTSPSSERLARASSVEVPRRVERSASALRRTGAGNSDMRRPATRSNSMGSWPQTRRTSCRDARNLRSLSWLARRAARSFSIIH
jgi:methylenetetrahydrofolate reductase (NADPH)